MLPLTTVEEFDARFEEANQRLEKESSKIQGENRQLEILLLEKKTMLANMEAIGRLTKSRKIIIDKEIAEIIKAA
jgi:hypothetical protein